MIINVKKFESDEKMGKYCHRTVQNQHLSSGIIIGHFISSAQSGQPIERR